MKAMLIDDSRTMREAQRSILTALGCEQIEEAGDGREALAKVDQFAPDLILCDSTMPTMNGVEFVRQLRRANTTAKIVMVSSDTDRAGVAQAIKAGADNFVAKPFTPDVLSQRINETMASARAAGPCT